MCGWTLNPNISTLDHSNEACQSERQQTRLAVARVRSFATLIFVESLTVTAAGSI
jgi:hypothetical protein